MWARKVVESPDSAQPKPPHAGSCHSVPSRSWPAARKVSAPAGEAVTPAVEAGALNGAAELAGAVLPAATGVAAVVLAVLVAGDTAELLEELQAVNSTATHVMDAQDASGRAPSALLISMMSNPFNP